MTTALVRIAAVAAAAIVIAGCGSSGSSSSSSSATTAPTTAATSMTSGSSGMEGGSKTAAAPIPPDLKCSDAIVWVNLSSKAYHLSGDKYYGRSKHGEYMCESAAGSKGYHLAGSGHGHKKAESPAPEAT